jgi:hypothetical protein
MVKITSKGSGFIAEIRQYVVNKIRTLMREYLKVEEGMAWRRLYRKIANCSDKLQKK